MSERIKYDKNGVPIIDTTGCSDFAKTLIESAREMVMIEKGLLTEKDGINITTYSIPAKVDVKKIRKKLGVTQKEFAKFGFSTSAIRHWEQGLRKPESSTRVLLKIIEKYPGIVLDVLGKPA